MKRGEVWWADLGPPLGRRPVVLVSRNAAYAARKQAIVGLITVRAWGIEAEVPLGPEDGLPQRCVANLDVILTIRQAKLRDWIAMLSPEKLRAVDAALRFALGLR